MKFNQSRLGPWLVVLGGLITLNLYAIAKLTGPNTPPMLVLSQISALLGGYLLAVNFCLSSRLINLERWFGGLDKLYRVHHLVGGLAFGLLCQHPIWLIVQALPNTGVASQYIWPSLSNLPYTYGELAFWSLAVLLGLTLFVNLAYHIWLSTHEWLGLVELLGLLHVFTISSDVSRDLSLRLWMLGWLGLGLIAAIYKRLVYRSFGPRYNYRIEELTINEEVITMRLRSTGKQLNFKPGQFVFVETPISREHHPFSLASSPNQPELTLMIKAVGDYSKRLKSLRVGQPVKVFGPYGMFLSQIKAGDRVALIAGGIGITPFLSLSGQANRKWEVIHSVRTAAEVMSQTGLNYQAHISSAQGRLTGDKILKRWSNDQTDYYCLCGPTAFTQSLRRQLRQLGVADHKIIYEDFALK